VPEQHKNPSDHRIVFAVRFLSKNYLNSNNAIGEIVGVLHLSPSRFRHLFKQHTGFSPAQYVKDLRLRYARELLERSNLSVKEVMAAVGLNDFSHFVRDFKAMHGVTPLQARVLRMAARVSLGQQDWPTDSHFGQDNVISITNAAVKLPGEPS
jgi:AraC-like DNA-binding protein